MDPVTILAALGPLAVDLGKSLINRFIAPDQFKPATIEQYAQMKQIDLEFFKVMNEAGGGNPSYPWLEAIVRLMRPFIGLLVLATWATMHLQGIATPEVKKKATKRKKRKSSSAQEPQPNSPNQHVNLLPGGEKSMYRSTKTLILAALILAVSATLALAQKKMVQLDGTVWPGMPQGEKMAYVVGLGNMASYETAVGGAGRGFCISKAFVDELKAKSVDSIVAEVDKYYKEMPDKVKTPVIDVVLIRCTKLCPQEAPAAGKAPKK